MAWSRSTKPNGTTSYANSEILRSPDLETDIANGVTEVNGNLANTNISASADIAPTKIGDSSATDAAHVAVLDPGDSAAHILPTTQQGENQNLRFGIKRLAVGETAKRLDGTVTTDDASWNDDPVRGPNLVRNGNFMVKTTAAGAAPDGWALVGTPGTCALTTAGVTEGHSTMRAIRIAAAGAANEGISQTLVGLKASTKYQIGCRGKVNAAGDILTLATTGATGATFGNLALATSSTTYVTLSGIILTDATPTNIVLQLLATADGDSVDVTHCWVKELTIDPIPTSAGAWAVNSITTSTADHYANGVGTDSGVTVAIVVPGPGYVIEVYAKADVAGSGATVNGVFHLVENGTTVRDHDYVFCDSAADSEKDTARLFYVNTSPTPGTTYTYTIQGAGHGDTLDRNPGSAIAGETAITTIRARAYLESGGH